MRTHGTCTAFRQDARSARRDESQARFGRRAFRLSFGAAALTFAACIDGSAAPPAGIAPTNDGGTIDDVDGSTTRDGGDAVKNDGAADDSGTDDSGTATSCDHPKGNFHDVKAWPSIQNTEILGIATLGDDDVIVGRYQSDFALDESRGVIKKGQLESSDDAFVVKIRANGTVAWQIGVGAKGDDSFGRVVTDEKGDVYVSGHFDKSAIKGTLNAEPFPSEGSFPEGDKVAYVMKLDGATGKLRWFDRFTQNVPGDNVCGQLDVSNGHLVVTCSMGNGQNAIPQSYVLADGKQGTLPPLSTNQNFGSALYDLDPSNGALRWAFSLGPTSTGGVSVQSVKITDGHAVVAGMFTESPLASSNGKVSLARIGTSANGFVLDLDVKNGNPTWSRAFGDPTARSTPSTFRRLTAIGTSSTSLVIGGEFKGFVTLGGTELSSGSASNVFFARYDAQAGTPTWQKQLGATTADTTLSAPTGDPWSSDPWDLKYDACGRLAFALRTKSALTVDGVAFPTPHPEQAASFVGRLDPSGVVRWVNGPTPAGTTATEKIRFGGFTIDAKNQTVIGGSFLADVDFGDGQTKTSASGGRPPFILFYTP